SVLSIGTDGAKLGATDELVQLRLLNASNARVYNFGFADDREFALVGTDGGLLPAPHRTNRIQLSPGERAEVVVAMRPGEQTVLRSYPPDIGGLLGRFSGADDSFDVLQLRAADELAPSVPVPEPLAPAPALDLADAQVTRSFRMSDSSINGGQMEMDRIDEVVEVDTTELWEVSSADGIMHSFHVHDVQFQVVSVDGAPPAPELSGWKDTIFLPP